MQLWLLVAAGAFAVGGVGACFFSTRPLLYTRLFVSRDERPLIRREIMDGSDFQPRMRRKGIFLFLLAAGCAVAAFLVKQTV